MQVGCSVVRSGETRAELTATTSTGCLGWASVAELGARSMASADDPLNQALVVGLSGWSAGWVLSGPVGPDVVGIFGAQGDGVVRPGGQAESESEIFGATLAMIFHWLPGMGRSLPGTVRMQNARSDGWQPAD